MTQLGFSLVNMPEIFLENYFFVPDYQRGYAWNDSNVEDLLKDIIHLTQVADNKINHYTGTLVLTKPVESNSEVLRYGIVDGQQRITTLIILMRCIAEAVRTFDQKLHDRLQETYMQRGEYGNEKTVLLLGNEIHTYFEMVIIGDLSHEEAKIEYNAHQSLLDAKSLIEKWLVRYSKGDEGFYKKLTYTVEKGLGFLVYCPEDITEVGIMFEVINNRGKPLSELEKVKNYLIYCSDKLGAGTLHSDINENWSSVLKNLRSARKTTSADESPFLRYCSVVHLKLETRSSQYVYTWLKSNWDVETALGDTEKKEDLIKKIRDFSSFMALASQWYENIFGQANNNISHDIDNILNVLKDIQSQNTHASVMPLILAVLIKNKGKSKRVFKLLRLIALLNFRVYVAHGIISRSDSGQAELYQYAHEYYNGEWDSKDNFIACKVLIDSYDKWLELKLCDFTNRYCNDEVFNRSFSLTNAGNNDFYRWVGLRYFLMSYEEKLQPKKTIHIDRIIFGRSEVKTNDYYSIEHVWAIKNRNATGQNDRPNDFFEKRRLGNFVLLELGINIAAQDFDIKKKIKIYNGKKQATDLNQVRRLIEDVECTAKGINPKKRFTKNCYLEFYQQICNAQEERFKEFALERWSLDEYLCSCEKDEKK